jgi:hypothetical protein
MTILSISSDSKTVKGEKKGYLTGILYMAPHSIGGFGNVCPMAGECKTPCLYHQGRARVFNSIQLARIERKRLYFQEPEAYETYLRADIMRLKAKAMQGGYIPVVRLNGTSDIFGAMYRRIVEDHPDIQFYDYTKVHRRLYDTLPSNYHITLSRDEKNTIECIDALQAGKNVAAVFAIKKGQPLPDTWYGAPVIDGDETDLRFLDPPGVVVGLRAKGSAIKDTSGFVIHV